MLSPVRLYRPSGHERVAIVSVEAAYGDAGKWLVRIALGVSSDKLHTGTTLGPFADSELEARFAETVKELRDQGFGEGTREDWSVLLGDADARVRARTAQRIGWRQDRKYVDTLLARLPLAVDDLCSIVDALGAIGDPKAVDAVKEIAQRKLLSRRRSGVEALRNLGDAAVLDQVLLGTFQALSPTIQSALDQSIPDVGTIADAIRSVESKRLAFTLDQVYELNRPVANEAIRSIIVDMNFDQPFVWRYIKSIFKRSMLRHDPVMFGWLAYKIEAKGRLTTGRSEAVKSGYDGVERTTLVFGRRTQRYVRRSAWRYLRNLARYRPHLYTEAAAEAVVPYVVQDGRQPRGLYGQFSDCYLLHRVLLNGSSRFSYDDRRMRFRFRNALSHQTPDQTREEAFPHLWDRYPKPYLRVLGAASLELAQTFARDGFARHGDLLTTASNDELIRLLEGNNEEVLGLVLNEIESRFDPNAPNWALMDRCVGDERESVLVRARSWIEQSHSAWTADHHRTLRYLGCRDRQLREIVIARTIDCLSRDEASRRGFVDRILPLMREPETQGLEAVGRVARECLTAELSQRLSQTELLAMIFTASPSIQAVAAHVFCLNDSSSVTLEQIFSIASHDVAAVRKAAHDLMARQTNRLKSDPDTLFMMLESRWPDSRLIAKQFLEKHIDWSEASFDRVMGLLDSNLVDVQDFGQEIVQQQWQQLDPVLLVNRLCEHHDQNMRRFAFGLAQNHLPEGADALESIEHFVRVVIMEIHPDQKTRDQLIAFLVQRGLQDAEQAAIASRYLEMILPTQGQRVFERVLAGMTRLKLRWPQLELPFNLQESAS